MSRKLASIVEISKVSPIEGADRLEVAEMKGKGWKVVIQKGEFHPGDLAVYFEIDSFLDPNDERYAFLKDRSLRRFVSKGGNVLREGIKIKTIKLRGQISQGLLMPLDKFPEILARVKDFKPEYVREGWLSDEALIGKVFIVETAEEYNKRMDEKDKEWIANYPNFPPAPRLVYTDNNDIWKFFCAPLIGADVTALLHVEHYDEVKESLSPQMGNPICADALGKFPSDYIPKTDEERLANLNDWFDTMKGRKWQLTVKADGSSCTIAFSPTIDFEHPQIVCSRNLRLKHETADGKTPVYWQVAEKYGILDKLGDLFVGGLEYAMQGEVVGPWVQKCRNGEKEYKFLCFRIWDIKNQKWVNPNETVDICKKLQIPHVQVLKTDYPFFDEVHSYDEAVELAVGKTAEGNEREGIVCKTVDNGPYASFKVISPKYLLKNEE